MANRHGQRARGGRERDKNLQERLIMSDTGCQVHPMYATTALARRAARARFLRSTTLALIGWVLAAGLIAPASRASSEQSNPFRGAPLFVNPDSDASRQVRAWTNSRPRDAHTLEKIASQPQAEWLGGWLPDVQGYVHWWIQTKLQAAGDTAFFVVYDLPHRDCSGHYSAGGAGDGQAYRAWIDAVAQSIGTYPAIVIVEPDGIPDSACLAAAPRRERLALIRYATSRLAALPNTSVYIDAGRSDWRSSGATVGLLRAAGVAQARGFSLDVTGYATTRNELRYGHTIARALGGKHFVVSTSRNGRGPWSKRHVSSFQDLWCNERGRALGPPPTVHTGERLADAFEWILRPGYSDGYCNGGQRAGTWWPTYALELASNTRP